VNRFRFTFFLKTSKCSECGKRVMNANGILHNFEWCVPFVYYHNCDLHEHQLEKKEGVVCEKS